MTKRSAALVIVLSLLTGGLYGFYWLIATKDEMVEGGASIPTAWIWLIPFAGIYWLWKWSEGVEHVSRGRQSAGMTFVTLLAFGLIGMVFLAMAILQSTFNQVDDMVTLPRARIA